MLVTHLGDLDNSYAYALESTFQVSYKLVIPKLRPTINIHKACFMESGNFTCCSKQSWCYYDMHCDGKLHYIPVEVVAHQGSCNMAGCATSLL